MLRKTSSTPAVVPGAAPALAKAGVGGYGIPVVPHKAVAEVSKIGNL